MSEKIIQDHEEWFKTTYPATYRDAKEGRDFDALCHFDHSLAGWQASRAARLVELPDSFRVNLQECFAADEVIDAIHAVGVKTK